MRKVRSPALVALTACWLAPGAAAAVDSPAAAPPPPAPPSTDRLVLSANGSTLSDANGGGGGSLAWLHDLTAGVLGIGGEYQKLANAHWAFGSLSGSATVGSAAAKWTFSGDAHLGSGDIGTFPQVHHFNYQVEGGGVAGTFGGKLTVQLEAHQYDIDTTHGALPRAALGFFWTPHLQTTVSYARSVSGNLGTELETARINYYSPIVNWQLGGATGHVAPPVVNLYTGLTGPAPQLREGYLGLSKSFARVDWSLVGDYLKVATEKRITVTLVCTLHIGSGAS